MYYCVIYRTPIDIERLKPFKEKYDPYYPGIGAHITLVFPVPSNEISAEEFTEHITKVVANQKPFPVRLAGFEKSIDHWLFLSVQEGRQELLDLHDRFYTGPLQKYLREDLPFSPHVGLGLFTKKDSSYDLENPTVLELDTERYETALKEVEALNLDYNILCDRVNIIKIEKDLKTIVFEKEVIL